jgi:hypothetical protein
MFRIPQSIGSWHGMAGAKSLPAPVAGDPEQRDDWKKLPETQATFAQAKRRKLRLMFYGFAFNQ